MSGRMQPLFVHQAASHLDALKFAYAFMGSPRIRQKECRIASPNPLRIHGRYVLPRAAALAVFTERSLPTWSAFKLNPMHQNVPFTCSGFVECEPATRQRVRLAYVEGKIAFSCSGAGGEAVSAAWLSVLGIRDSLA